MSRLLLEAVKVLLSIPVAYALLYPFLLPEPVGIAKELAVLGLPGSIALGVGFFALVVLYANDLRSVLSMIAPSHRRATPRSVWWMLLIPYNFVEDFFIIHAVTESLRRESAHTKRLSTLGSFGQRTGFGWCAAQIGSLIPNALGSLFGLLALILWIAHWRLIRRAKRALRGG